MNIGFDSKRLFNNFTGLGNYSRALVGNLVTYYPENLYFLYTPKINHHFKQVSPFNTPNCKTYVPDVQFKSFWRSVSIVKQLKKDKIQLYHGLSHEIPLNINKSKIRSVVTIHDLIFKIYPDTYSLIDRTLYNLKFKYACSHADKIIAISESTKKDIIHFYNIHPEKIEVIYQSCNSLYYSELNNTSFENLKPKYGIPDEYLLYVGSVIPRKNIITIIKSYHLLPKDLQIPLIIVGKGGRYTSEVKRLIETLGLKNLVHWIDKLTDNEELKTLYEHAKIFIYPSVYEGFGLPIAEALLCMVPVITSNVSSLPEAGGPNSYYIDPKEPIQMAEGISKILTDTEFRMNMVKNGYTYALQMFDKQIITSKLMNLYKNTIS